MACENLESWAAAYFVAFQKKSKNLLPPVAYIFVLSDDIAYISCKEFYDLREDIFQ